MKNKDKLLIDIEVFVAKKLQATTWWQTCPENEREKITLEYAGITKGGLQVGGLVSVLPGMVWEARHPNGEREKIIISIYG